jgi:nitric oxide reductase subunit B
MFLMIVVSLLPIGLLQTLESVQHGYWSARSAEFMQTPLMQNLRWLRVLGDTIFGLGAFAFVWFAIDLIVRKPRPEAIPAGELVEA